MGRLAGRRVIVTGAGSGIGRAIVERFLAEGAQVVCVIRNDADLAELRDHPDVEIIVGDVASYDTNKRAVEAAKQRFDGLDAFIANAGVWDFHKRLSKMSSETLASAYEDIMSVNFRAPLFAAHAAAEALLASRGTFIVTGSNACFRAGGGGVLYTASKFALRGLVQQLALEMAPGVRVNGVAPGATDTGLSGSAALEQRDREMNADKARVSAMATHIPLKYVSMPADHTGLYVLLASVSEAPYVTGSIFVSDGGLIAGI